MEGNIDVSTSSSQAEQGQASGNNVSPQQPVDSGNNMVPKYRFDEINRRCQEAETKLADMQRLIDEGKQKDARISALEKELADTKSGYELEKTNAKRASAVENAIRDKVVDVEVVQKLLDMDKISFDDKGEVKGLEEQLKSLQTSKPYLWKPAKPVVKPGDKGTQPTEKSFAQKMAEQKKAQLSVSQKTKNYF